MLLFSFLGLLFFTSLLAAISHIAGIANFLKAFFRILLVGLGIIVLGWITSPLRTKMVLDKEDYYGQYVINRKYFRGNQADWQYNTFRFEIKKNDSIYFYVTNKADTLKVYKGMVRTTDSKNYVSPRLIIDMEEPSHHILADNPTTYRQVWDFDLVFESPKFYNVCFTKGKWEPLE